MCDIVFSFLLLAELNRSFNVTCGKHFNLAGQRDENRPVNGMANGPRGLALGSRFRPTQQKAPACESVWLSMRPFRQPDTALHHPSSHGQSLPRWGYVRQLSFLFP